MSRSPATPSEPQPESGVQRRSFVASALAMVIGAFVTIVPLIPGAAFFLDPLLRKRRVSGGEAGDEFVKVTTLAALPAVGVPQAFPVFMDKQDAWNKFPNAEVGAVFLTLQQDGTVASFNARCPHLGCTINFSQREKQYVCPCHASAFSLDGARTNAVPPRSMDALKAEIRNGNEVWVAFQNFRAGTHEQIPTG